MSSRIIKVKKALLIFLTVSLLFAYNLIPVIAATDKVDINIADKATLITLQGVGDKIADRIIEHRKNHPFEKPEDIMIIKGIGENIYKANEDKIIVRK